MCSFLSPLIRRRFVVVGASCTSAEPGELPRRGGCAESLKKMDKKPAVSSAAAADISGDDKGSDEDGNEVPDDPHSMPATKVMACV